jgi:hypothetical protein
MKQDHSAKQISISLVSSRFSKRTPYKTHVILYVSFLFKNDSMRLSLPSFPMPSIILVSGLTTCELFCVRLIGIAITSLVVLQVGSSRASSIIDCISFNLLIMTVGFPCRRLHATSRICARPRSWGILLPVSNWYVHTAAMAV